MRKIWIFLFVVAAMLLLFIGFRFYLRSLVNGELAALRSAGYPVSLSELDAWYEKPPAGQQNAADMFATAFLEYSHEWDSQKVSDVIGAVGGPPRSLLIPSASEDLLVQCLIDNSEALRLLHKAAEMEYCRYAICLADQEPLRIWTGEVDLPHLENLQHGSLLLSAEALLHVKEGSSADAVQSILSMLGVSRSLLNEPLLQSQATRLAIERISVEVLRRLLNAKRLTDEGLLNLYNAYADAEAPKAWSRAAAGQQCIGLAFFTLARTGSSVNGGSKKEIELPFYYTVSGICDMDYLHYMELAGEYMAVYNARFPLSFELEENLATRLRDTPRRFMLSWSAVAYGFPSFVERIAAARACVRSARTAIAIERYEGLNGKLPENLEQLVPLYLEALPLDPCDGRRLRYRHIGAAYSVYSVGLDREDNGGDEKQDIAFAVKR